MENIIAVASIFELECFPIAFGRPFRVNFAFWINKFIIPAFFLFILLPPN